MDALATSLATHTTMAAAAIKQSPAMEEVREGEKERETRRGDGRVLSMITIHL